MDLVFSVNLQIIVYNAIRTIKINVLFVKTCFIFLRDNVTNKIKKTKVTQITLIIVCKTK